MPDRNLVLSLAKVTLAAAVAVADGFVSELELREIGSIASWLYVPRKAYIDAKLKIPSE